MVKTGKLIFDCKRDPIFVAMEELSGTDRVFAKKAAELAKNVKACEIKTIGLIMTIHPSDDLLDLYYEHMERKL